MDKKTIEEIIEHTSEIIPFGEVARSLPLFYLHVPEKYWSQKIVNLNLEKLSSLEPDSLGSKRHLDMLDIFKEELHQKISAQNIDFDVIYLREYAGETTRHLGNCLKNIFNVPIHIQKMPFRPADDLKDKKVLYLDTIIRTGWHLDTAAEYTKHSGGELVLAAALVFDDRRIVSKAGLFRKKEKITYVTGKVGWITKNMDKVIYVLTSDDYIKYHKPVLEQNVRYLKQALEKRSA